MNKQQPQVSAVSEELYTFKLFMGCGPDKKRRPLCNTGCLAPEDQPAFSYKEKAIIEAKLKAQKKEMSRVALQERLAELRKNKERLELMQNHLEGHLETQAAQNDNPSNKLLVRELVAASSLYSNFHYTIILFYAVFLSLAAWQYRIH